METHTAPDCTDVVAGGSANIGNYGSVGPCNDTVNGHNYPKAFNDGCPLYSQACVTGQSYCLLSYDQTDL